jgi:hypothetical protein
MYSYIKLTPGIDFINLNFGRKLFVQNFVLNFENKISIEKTDVGQTILYIQ